MGGISRLRNDFSQWQTMALNLGSFRNLYGSISGLILLWYVKDLLPEDIPQVFSTTSRSPILFDAMTAES
jgi:hypothetical protein